MNNNLHEESRVLFEKSRLLHIDLSKDLTLVTAEQIEMAQRKRDRFKIEIDEILRAMKKQVEYWEDHMSLLRIEKKTHTVDNSELETAKWRAVHGEKDSTKPTFSSDV